MPDTARFEGSRMFFQPLWMLVFLTKGVPTALGAPGWTPSPLFCQSLQWGGVCTSTPTWPCHCCLCFPSLQLVHPTGRAGQEQAQSRLPVVCADAPVPKASPLLGDVIQFTLGALGTGCAGWERRNANEIGLGNAAGLGGTSLAAPFSSRDSTRGMVSN